MAQSTVNIRMDEEIKREFDRVCNELGINMSIAINILAKKMIREERIPFEVSVDPIYAKSNTEALLRSAKQIEEGKTVVRSIKELEDMASE